MLRKTVAIFADGGFLAHVTRCLEVGRALARYFGHRVVFCASGPYAHILKDAGYEVRPVYTIDRKITMTLAKQGHLGGPRWWREACETSVASDLEVLRAVRPDVVVGDLHWSLSTSARILGIPYVAVTNALWTRYYQPPLNAPAEHFLTRWFGQRGADLLFPVAKQVIMWMFTLGYTNIRKRYKLPPITSGYDLTEGDVTLLADIPEYGPTALAPDNVRHVGPILWDADLPVPEWLGRLDPRRPTIYFTLGSTGDIDFFSEAVRVFGDTEYQVLMTTGGLTDLGPTPANVFVEKFAPGEALMKKSDVVISHGGNGTIYQALSCGVPVIGFPAIFEQEFHMQRVCALGAGVRMWRSAYRPDSLRKAVETVLSDAGMRARCHDLERRIGFMDGRRRAALHIHTLLQTGNPARVPENENKVLQHLPAREQAQGEAVAEAVA